MSRLDSAIRRLQAQRLCLDHAMELIAGVKGPVFELGLGNGRTYDHLKCHLPDREIFVFDRQVLAHPDCIPDDDHMFKGDFADSLPNAEHRFRGRVALIHADIGSGVEASNQTLASFLAERLPLFLTQDGLLLSDQELLSENLQTLAPPSGVDADRYFMYRRR